MTCAHKDRELLGGYVLGALEPEEEARVRAHLETCEPCAAEYASLAEASGMLELVGPGDMPLPSPPPRLEEALLDRHARETRPVRALRPRRRPTRRAALAGALAAAAAGVVAVAALTGGDGAGEHHEGAVRLAASDSAPGAEGSAQLSDVSAGTGVRLSLHGLPRSRTVYTLWCVRDDGRWISAGSFRVDGRGDARASLTAAVRRGEYGRVLVTRAPSDSEARHGPTVLAGNVDYE